MQILGAVFPIFLIMGLGYGLARVTFLTAENWSALERLSLYVVFPALIISVLSAAEFSWGAMTLIGLLSFAQIIMGIIGWFARFWPNMQAGTIASTIQSNVRWNAFIGLSLAENLLGPNGLALMVVLAAGMIPMANILSVSAFEAYGPASTSMMKKLRSVLTNPLIVACFIGIGLSLLPVPIWQPVHEAMNILARAAIAIGLLCAGAAIQLSGLRRDLWRLSVWSAVRLLGLPLLVIFLAPIFNVDGMALTVAIIAAATPTATNGVILAKQLHGDGVFAANLVALQSILSLATIPLLLWFFVT